MLFFWLSLYLKPWCWRRLLRVPWTPRRSSQSILKETNPEYSLEGLILKLKLQYFGHQMRRANSLEKTLMLRKIEGRRRRWQKRMRWVGWHHWLNGRKFEQTLGDSEEQGSLACAVHGVPKSWTQLSDWTTTALYPVSIFPYQDWGMGLMDRIFVDFIEQIIQYHSDQDIWGGWPLSVLWACVLMSPET